MLCMHMYLCIGETDGAENGFKGGTEHLSREQLGGCGSKYRQITAAWTKLVAIQ